MVDAHNADSFYEILDGSIYDKTLLKLAADTAKECGGEISYEAAKVMWTKVGDDKGEVTEVDIRTLELIMQREKFERTAMYFVKEAVKVAKQDLRTRQKEEAKASGVTPRKSKSPKKNKSPGSPRLKASKEEPFQKLVRLTEELSNAGSLSQVKRLEKAIAVLSPMRQAEMAEAEAEKEEKRAAKEAAAAEKREAREAAAEEKRVAREEKDAEKEAERKKRVASSPPKSPKKAKGKGLKAVSPKKASEAVHKRPAMKEVEAPSSPPRKGMKLKLKLKGRGKAKEAEKEAPASPTGKMKRPASSQEPGSPKKAKVAVEEAPKSPSKGKALLKRPASQEAPSSPKKAAPGSPKKAKAGGKAKAAAPGSPKKAKPVAPGSPKKAKLIVKPKRVKLNAVDAD